MEFKFEKFVDTSENEGLSKRMRRKISISRYFYVSKLTYDKHLKVSNICNKVCRVLHCYKCSIVNTIINI